MVEQTNTSKGHSNVVLITSVNNMVVANAATSLSNVLNATLVGSFYVVTEWEECITTQTDVGVLSNPFFFLIACERFGLLCEELLPFSVSQNIHIVIADIDIYCVVAVGPTDIGQERQRHNLGILTQPPDVGLVTSQAGTVDTTLLTGSDANSLTVLNVAYAVALGVLKSDEGDN